MSRGWQGRSAHTGRYGGHHQKARRAALDAWIPGQPCAICGRPTTQKGRLHLAHAPGSDTRYLGLAHIECNLGAAGALTDRAGRPKNPDPEPRPWAGW